MTQQSVCDSESESVLSWLRYCDNILVLLQDLYMFRVPVVPIIKSTVLQWTV
jgi:hypothetical protein